MTRLEIAEIQLQTAEAEMAACISHRQMISIMNRVARLRRIVIRLTLV